LISVIVYVWIGYQGNTWPVGELRPAPLNSWPGFIALLMLLLFFSWQTHKPPNLFLLYEVGLGFVLGFLITFLGRWLKIQPFVQATRPWSAGLRVALFLFAALLLWPRGSLDEPLHLALAIGISLLSLTLSRQMLKSYLSREG
jgi:hypothetical protein